MVIFAEHYSGTQKEEVMELIRLGKKRNENIISLLSAPKDHPNYY